MNLPEAPINADEPIPDIELDLAREASSVEKAKEGTAIVRGIIKYPWGSVKDATVNVGEKSAVSDKEGNYEITGLASGSYSAVVHCPFPGYEAQPQEVQLLDGETKVVDFYLDFGKTVVEGHVYDPDGKPIVGATISGVYCGNDFTETTTDVKGHFKFDRASPKNQFIRVNAQGYMGQTRDFATKQQETTTLEFHLTRATSRIHGTVKDTDNRPLRAVIHLSSSAHIILERTTSDAETGHYEFAVLPGEYNLLATEQDHEYEGWRGSVSSETEVNFKLPVQIHVIQKDRSERE